jgi:hypothetical protein
MQLVEQFSPAFIRQGFEHCIHLRNIMQPFSCMSNTKVMFLVSDYAMEAPRRLFARLYFTGKSFAHFHFVGDDMRSL